MDEEELKRIHGEDVELAPDDTEDDKLTEEDALAEAAAQGINFIDKYYVVKIERTMIQAEDNGYDTREEAEADRQRRDDPEAYTILQTRSQAPQDTQIQADAL